MGWTTWIIVGALIAFGIYSMYPFSRPRRERIDTRIEFPVTKKEELVYTPPSLPYTIHEFHHLLSDEECRTIQEQLVVTQRADQTTYVAIPFIQNLASRLTRQPPSHMEPLEIGRYTKGGTVLDVDTNGNELCQTRIAALVFFLNEAYVGGEMVFPHANERTIVPHQGKAVLYWTVAGGNVLPESLHRNKFVLRGVQWKAVQYIHSVPISS